MTVGENKWICAPRVDTETWRAEEEYDTKEEAIEAGRKAAIEKGRLAEDVFGDYCDPDVSINHFAVGQKQVPGLNVYIDDVLERIGESVYEQVGESADDYLLDVTNEDKDALEKIILDWVIKKYPPNCFVVTEIEKVGVSK